MADMITLHTPTSTQIHTSTELSRDVEDHVVDITFEVHPSGARLEPSRVRGIVAPGREQDRVVGPDALTITTVVTAATALGAVTNVHDVLRDQLRTIGARISGTRVLSAPLSVLLGLADLDPEADEPVDVDLLGLLEHHLWNQPEWAYEEYVAAQRLRMATTG